MTVRVEPADVVRRARVGVFGIFLLSGLTVALWGAALPAVNHRLDLGEARLGTVLLATGLGALTCMPVAGRLCDRWSSRRVVSFAAPASAFALIGPALAPSYPWLLSTTFVFGAGIGALDVSMNAHAVEVEQRYPRPILSAFHGVWSLGGVVGGSAIAAGLYLRINVQAVMVVGAIIAAMVFIPPARMLLVGRSRRDRLDSGEDIAGAVPLPRRLVYLLGLVAFAAFISEGAAMDWSALHANRVLGADLATASLAYTVFTVSMTTTRLLGDRLRGRFGPVWTIQKAAGTASLGYFVVLVSPALPRGGLLCAYAGWVLVGLGLAMVVPVIFATAGAGSAAAGLALSRVTTFGYVGMLAGPSVIGPLAEATSLTAALALPAALALGIAVLGPVAVRRVADREGPPRRLAPATSVGPTGVAAPCPPGGRR